jgi:ribosomal protein S1
MKKLVLLLSVVFVAGVAAQEAQKPDPANPAKEPTSEKAATGKTHEVQAEIVSVAPDGKTLTIKGETGEKTVPVDEKATAAVKSLKAGDKATLICRDSDKGEHQAVTGVKAPEKKY